MFRTRNKNEKIIYVVYIIIVYLFFRYLYWKDRYTESNSWNLTKISFVKSGPVVKVDYPDDGNIEVQNQLERPIPVDEVLALKVYKKTEFEDDYIKKTTLAAQFIGQIPPPDNSYNKKVPDISKNSRRVLEINEDKADIAAVSKKIMPTSNEQESIKFPGKGYPGELGRGVTLPEHLDEKIKRKVAEGWETHQFNEYVSDLIPVRRSILDPRDERCKAPWRFEGDLPSTSVIICFYNEAWSVLLRTVHSVLDRSPEHLLHEIILVDDFSDMEQLKDKLDNYWSKYPKVKILHLQTREGLIRARNAGIRHATGEVLTFLDSHVECAPGWLPPLLHPIFENPATVTLPIVDWIDANTFEVHFLKKVERVQTGGFDWTLSYTWRLPSVAEKSKQKDPTWPIETPTMIGGLFSINRKFFEKLGFYDPGFDIWGGENLELSFKTWMCGGSIVCAPCSLVAHVYRTKRPKRNVASEKENFLNKNLARLAEVWMDDYKKYFYRTLKNTDLPKFGDVSDRKKLRNELGCKSFKWYLENIYPDRTVPDN